MENGRLRTRLSSILLLVGMISESALAAPGDLDPSFGTGGVAEAVAGPAAPPVASVGAAIARQADGSIVVATDDGSSQNFLVRRYLANGTPDGTFGTGGVATIDFGGGDDVPYAVAIQSDGRIVVGGTSTLAGAPRAAIARLTTGGVLDATFGTGGKVVSTFGAITTARDLALQANDRVVIVGETGSSFFPDAYVARYTTAGALDGTFGTGGVAVQSVGSWSDSGFAVAVQPNGAILAGGLAFVGGDFGQWFVLRFTTAGVLDASFGDGGIVETDPGGGMLAAEVLDIVVQPDGSILAGGPTGTTLLDFHSDFAIARYEPDGDPDPGWGTDGVVVTPVLAGSVGTVFTPLQALALQPDGAVLAIGSATTSSTKPVMHAVVARYLPDGDLDPSWGGDGLVTVAKTFGGGVLGVDAVLQPDGRLLIAARDQTKIAALRLLTGSACGDGAVDDGEECDDGNTSDGDCCSSTCTIDEDGAPCDDGEVCTTVDGCVAGACVGTAAPALGCRAGQAGALVMTRSPAGNETLSWVWRKGAATSIEEIPEQRYTLCVYDQSPAEQPIARLATQGPLCGTKLCFTSSAKRTTYADPAGTSDGIRKVVLTSGLEGKASAQLVARGDQLTLPAMPLVGSVSAQLHAENGVCWAATYTTVQRNDGSRFRAKVD